METIFTKEFYQLTDHEKDEMKDLFTTEEEFNQLKLVFKAVDYQSIQEQISEPSPHVKERLDSVFQERYPVKKTVFLVDRNKYWYQQNLFKIAAILTLLLSFIAIWNTNLKSTQVQVAENKIQGVKDTASEKITSPEKAAETVTTKEEERQEVRRYIRAEQNEFADMEAPEEETIAASEDIEETRIASPTVTGSTHPDGIYNYGAVAESDDKMLAKDSKPNAGFALKNNVKLLDLLTTAY